jgi:serine/threonine-protein kinase
LTAANKLTGCPTCGATISVDARFCGGCGSAISATEPTHAGSLQRTAPDQVGREIAGRYRILAKLGEGGMGAVYRAEQISLKRKVALKLLKPELSADAGLVRRFNAEAELAAKLNHPNTVTLYDFGQDSDASLFIAMEFIEGQSLREVMVAEGPLDVARTIKICNQVCSSLADAHGRGIVHRDLKPDNVMLSARGKQTDVVRVLDFGIAKLRDTQGDMTALPMTQAGDLLGTPQYMAPEQIRGEKVDARTDIYAMGAMIYEMITGRLPFEAPTLMAILSKHLTEMPVPPTERRADLGLPPPLSTLVMSMLAKSPDERPATMDRVSDQLEAIGAAAGTLSGSPSTEATQTIDPPRPSGPMSVPSVVSAPPGVPRRLNTPGPQPPISAPMTPAPAPVQPPPASHAPQHAPPVHHQVPSISPPKQPMPSHQMPARVQTPLPGQVPQPMQPRKSGGSGLVWATIAVLVIGGAGAGAFFALRAGDSAGEESGPGSSSNSASSTSSSSGDGDSDVPSLADWDIKGGDGDSGDNGDSGDKAPAPPPASHGPHSSNADFFGDPGVADETWNHPLLPMHVHHPKGFVVDTSVPPFTTISGMYKGMPLQIAVVALNAGAQPEAAVNAMVQGIVANAGGVVLDDGRGKFAGASRHTGTYEIRGQQRGQYVVFEKGSLLVIAAVATAPNRFAATAGFRDAFFNRAVALD